MKSNSIILIVLLFQFLNINAKAQGQGCTVALKTIAGTYTGDCNKGKADGKGVSVGTDKYTGDFKSGLPEGNGQYIWANGDTYEGNWVKGNRDGEGTLTKKDGTVQKGFWKKNAYIGAFEKPYIVYSKGPFVTSVDAKKNLSSTDNTITIKIEGGVTNTTTYNLGEVTRIKGSYGQILDSPPSTRGTAKRLSQVTYPFRAIYRMGSQEMEVEIFDAGDWTVTVEISE